MNSLVLRSFCARDSSRSGFDLRSVSSTEWGFESEKVWSRRCRSFTRGKADLNILVYIPGCVEVDEPRFRFRLRMYTSVLGGEGEEKECQKRGEIEIDGDM